MLLTNLNNYNIILASKSPRRQELMQKLQLDFTIQIKEVEEYFPKELKAAEITDFIAKLKANAFTNLKENDLLITSDTIVWHQNKALGKPKDRADAIAMLQGMSNTKHKVYTSICLKTNRFKKVFHDTTTVYFKKLSQQEIIFYVDTYKPYDKAGAYGIQDWIGLIGVKKIKGSYYNVMGFPIHKLYKVLQKL